MNLLLSAVAKAVLPKLPIVYQPFHSHQIGSYDVVIISSNPVTAALNNRVTVTILRPLRGVRIVDSEVSRVNETRNLTLTLEEPGTYSCVVVDFGDGSPAVAYGNCIDHPNRLGGLQSEVALWHVYDTQNNFNIKAYGWNTISSENISILIPVLEAKKHCGLAIVSIQNGNPGWWLPNIVTRNNRLSFLGVTKLDCWFTDNTKTWTLDKLDPQTGELLNKSATYELQQTGTATLLIKEFTLDIGLYRLSFKVTMNKTFTENIEFSAVAYDYFDVQRSQLIVALIQGQLTSLVKGWGTDLDLIPILVSRDPDLSSVEEQVRYIVFFPPKSLFDIIYVYLVMKPMIHQKCLSFLVSVM